MAHLDTEWKRLKQLEIDGVTYDICITPCGDMYRAAWVCAECCEQCAWAPISGSPAQASELAQIGLRMHHALVHPSRSKSRSTDRSQASRNGHAPGSAGL